MAKNKFTRRNKSKKKKKKKENTPLFVFSILGRKSMEAVSEHNFQ